MNTPLTTADSISYDLDRKSRYAVTTILTGLFVGASIALATGGSHVYQLAVTILIAAFVGGGSYWALCRLVAAVTGGTGSYRISYPTDGSARRAKSEREVGERETSGESTLVDAR